MKIQHAISISLLILLTCNACAQEPQTEYANDVERIISTLASDEMKGRYAFAPEAWEAARFIATEFEAIGLLTAEEDDDYFQSIPVYLGNNSEASVTVNGQAIAADRVASRFSLGGIDWTNESDIKVLIVGPDQDLRPVWLMNRRQGNAVLFIDPSHETQFNEFRRRNLPSQSRSMEKGAGPNFVGVLAEYEQGQAFAVTGGASLTEMEIANVVGRIEGNRTDEYVLFTAHYDHVAMLDSGVDRIRNGANDNASGTTAVIQLARHFASQPKPERTLLFVGFTAEESGGLGSRFFSQQLDPEKIMAMFNIEMIGKPAVEGPNTAWITGFDRSDFGAILQEAVVGTEYEFYADPYPSQNLFYRSDNATLARLGVPAHSISTTPIDVDPDYHQPSDEVHTLNLEHLTNTIDAIAAGATLIVSGERTPTRIDPETVN